VTLNAQGRTFASQLKATFVGAATLVALAVSDTLGAALTNVTLACPVAICPPLPQVTVYV